MISRKDFSEKIATLGLSRVDQAVAFLWFYRQNQIYEERTASELADDLGEEGFGRPNVTDLHKKLTKTLQTVKGKRSGTFQINVKYLDRLNKTYNPLINLKQVVVSSSVLPNELVHGTRLYIERMFQQVNGAYDFGFYDACAVIVRRLMESLIIETFIHGGLSDEIKNNGRFFELNDLIVSISAHKKIHLSRNAYKTMMKIKLIGDTAAHDRIYITQINDINDLKQDIHRLIQELLVLSGVIK